MQREKRLTKIALLASLCLALTPVQAETTVRFREKNESSSYKTARITRLTEDLGLEAEEGFPDVKSDYVYMVDMETGRVMLDKGGEDAIYPHR